MREFYFHCEKIQYFDIDLKKKLYNVHKLFIILLHKYFVAYFSYSL